ncbi:MAG: hypothetical protein Tsb0015_16800 [Simkaniaceae bacterium]
MNHITLETLPDVVLSEILVRSGNLQARLVCKKFNDCYAEENYFYLLLNTYLKENSFLQKFFQKHFKNITEDNSPISEKIKMIFSTIFQKYLPQVSTKEIYKNLFSISGIYKTLEHFFYCKMLQKWNIPISEKLKGKTFFQQLECLKKTFAESVKADNPQELDLSHLDLEYVPPEIFHLPVRAIRLNNNQLSHLYLDADLSKNNTLQLLDLSNNKLEYISPKISSLTSLQALLLDNNQLTELPRSIGSLSQLQTLQVNDNCLSGIPESFSDLKNLKKIFLQNNNLSSSDAEIFQRIPSLELLFIKNNPHINQRELQTTFEPKTRLF